MTTISTLPTAPSRADPATFSDRSDALLGALDTFVTETNTVVTEVNALAAAMGSLASGAATSIPYTFSTTTTDSDPGAGILRLDNATQNAATTIRVDLVGSDGSTWTSLLDTFDDSTSTIKGFIMLQKASDATKWLLFSVSALASPSGYKNITVANVASSAASPFANADALLLKFTRNGDKGETGATGAAGANGTNGTGALVANIVTATTATTLTSTPTLLKITPASYGVAVTLPDATTCNVGGPLHIIDNKGAYPVRVLNSAGTLLGFVFGGVVSHVSLADNSTSAGVWTIENNELVGASAQLLTTNITNIKACIDLGSGKECIVSTGASNNDIYSVVYDKTTNTFGSVTLVRTATSAGIYHTACLSGANQVLVVSCSSTTAFEAVTLSISGTTITVNTAATATLSANISTFADGCGLIAVGSSFVTSYTVATPAAQIRALSISGTTVTIGSATVLDGTAGGLIVASSDKVIAVSTATTHLYTKPYTVSGSSLSAGTGTDTNAGTKTLKKFFPTGSGRFFLAHNDATSGPYGGFVTLSGTTTSVSFALLVAAGAVTIEDAILLSTLKILIGSNGFCIVTDNGSGTASVSTNVDSFASGDSFLYVNGTTAYAQTGSSAYTIKTIDCSSTNPSVTVNQIVSSSVQLARNFASSNAIGVRSNVGIYGTKFAQYIASSIYNPTTDSRIVRVSNGLATFVYNAPTFFGASNVYRGKSDSERWETTTSTLTKIECVQ